MPTSPRRRSTTVLVGDVPVGSDHPIVVQSMTNTDTADPDATALQVAQLAHAGSELVRVTVNNDEAAQAVPIIREKLDRLGVDVPIIGDFHYNGHLLLTKYPACAETLAKYRINPGNVGGRHKDANFQQIIEVALAYVYRDAQLFLDALRSESRPAVLVLDWRLERGLSAPLFMAARHREPALPVVFWTGTAAHALPQMIQQDPRARVVDKADGTAAFESALRWALDQAGIGPPARPSKAQR